MNPGGPSLHMQVDKWLAPNARVPARVVRVSRTPVQRCPYVCVEAAHPAGTITIFFFRHGDGSWGVSPPADTRRGMTMRTA